MSSVKFECRSLGLPCEWALQSPSKEEIVERIKEHARCAHNMGELSPEMRSKVEAAIAPA
jgi:predicted small metal-binding protein